MSVPCLFVVVAEETPEIDVFCKTEPLETTPTVTLGVCELLATKVYAMRS